MDDVNLTSYNLPGFNKMVTSVKFNADGDLLFGTSKDTSCSAACWHVKSGALLGTYSAVAQGKRNYDLAMNACDVSSQSNLLATVGTGEETFIWSVETGALLGTISTAMSSGQCVAFSHDDRKLLVATVRLGRSADGMRGAISIYNVPFDPPPVGQDIAPTALEFKPELRVEVEDVSWASWGPTNDTIYFSSGKDMCVLDTHTGRVTREVTVHDGDFPIKRFKFETNSYLTLATCSEDTTVNLLDYRGLEVIQTYKNDLPVNDVSISPTADHVIFGGGVSAQDVTTKAGGSDFKVKFAHKVNGSSLGELKCHFGTINAMSFMPDGRGFVSAAADGQVKLFHFDENYYKVPGAVPLWTPPELDD